MYIDDKLIPYNDHNDSFKKSILPLNILYNKPLYFLLISIIFFNLFPFYIIYL